VRWLLAVGIFAGLGIGVSRTADAGLGLELEMGGTNYNSSVIKSDWVPCDGKLLLSGGAFITGEQGRIVLKGVIPRIVDFGNHPSYTLARAHVDQSGTNGSWSITGLSICGDYAAEKVTAASAYNSVSPKSATAACPSGKKVVGTGAETVQLPRGGDVVIDEVAPNSTLTAVTAKACEAANGFSGKWLVRAYAMCVDPFPFLQLERRTATSSAGNNSESAKTAQVGCSDSSKRVIGLGADIINGFGRVLLTDLYPNLTLTQVTVRAYEDKFGFAGDWDVKAFVICAVP
jgi:hypothetical protein